MKSLRKFFLFFCLAAFLSFSSAEARIAPTYDGSLDASQLRLGGVCPGLMPEEVVQTLGEPEQSTGGSSNMVWSYGNGTLVLMYRAGAVHSITSKGEGIDWTTADGIGVQQDAALLDQVYGSAAQEEELRDKSVAYAYWGNNTAPYAYLIFFVKDDKIVQIKCGRVA